MQLTQPLRRNAELFRDRIATISCNDHQAGDGEAWRKQTWGELADRVARLAAGLAALGMQPGDRVAIAALNSDRFVEAYYAIAWAGGVAVPFNTRWAAAEITYAFADSEPAMILVDTAMVGMITDLVPAGVTAIAMDRGEGCSDGALPDFDTIVAGHAPAPDRCGSNDDLAAIFYTGGTTGRSKGVMLSHRNLIANFLAYQAIAPYDRDSVFLHIPPMFHLADASCLFGLSMLGATHVILPGFELAMMLDAVERHQVTATLLVPTMITMICEELSFRGTTLPGIRRVTYGASSISPTVLSRAMAAFPNAVFCQGYGQTELSPIAAVLLHEDHLPDRLSAAGRAAPHTDIRIVDADGNQVTAGTVGEICVRGPGVMLGYWKLPEVTRETIVDGWLKTGDAGYLDDDGYLFLVDRVKDMIVSGAENIYSAEVEGALASHPDVLQCAVIGIPHEVWGEAVHAVIQLREGSAVTAQALGEHCAPLIARYKHPKSYDLRNAPLPLSGVGKIMKAELREPFWSSSQRRIA